MFVFYIFLTAILLFGATSAGKRKFNDDFLSLSTVKAFQGFLVIAIIIHHISQGIKDPKEMWIMTNVGVLCVGFFFFFSGYGVMKSLQTKPNYLDGFLKKRFISILVPFYLINIIFLTCFAVPDKLSPVEIILNLFGIQLINSQSWYIVAIGIFYLAFCLLFRKIKKTPVALAGMALFSCVYITVSLFAGHGSWWLQGEWWFNTFFLAFFGMLVAEYEKKVVAFAKKWYWVLLPVSIGGFAFMFNRTIYVLNRYSYYAEFSGGSGIPEKWICLSCQLPAVILFVAACLLIFMKIRFSNWLLKYLGSICIEVYLIQNLFLEGLHSDFIHVENNVLYSALVIALSVALGSVIHLADRKIISLLQGKPKHADQEKLHTA